MNALTAHQARVELTARIAKMDIPTLRAELAKALRITSETLSYLAAVWRELESRGEDLSDLRNGMGQYLPMIASGQLAAEAVIRFAGRQTLLKAVLTLPLGEQEALAHGRPVPVAALAKDNTVLSKEMSATSLTAEQIKMVFDHGRLRSLSEQENMLNSARIAARRKSKPTRSFKVRVDSPAGKVMVGRMSVNISEVLDALRVSGVLGIKAYQESMKHLGTKISEND